jgi:tetratricopeptide (TPR) repeat protein
MVNGAHGTQPAVIAANSFRRGLEEALEHFTEIDWLGTHSPLAAPYVLGADLGREPDADSAAGRGRALQRKLLAAAQSLPGRDGIYDPQRLLQVTYFRPNVNRTREGYAVELALSPATYYRHRNEAISQLESALVRHLRPGLRLEFPAPRAMVGRQTEISGCLSGLHARQLIAITGPSGMGKTTLGATVAAQWPDDGGSPQAHLRDVFWYTFRPGFNDQLSSLLFSLGFFLFQRGAPNLWLQLVAKPQEIDPNIALGLLRQDLAGRERPPLLCFDEVDLLRPADADGDERIRLRSFVEALADAGREQAPTLLLGQQLLVEADAHYVLNGFTPVEARALLAQHSIVLRDSDVEQLCHVTRGNPLLLRLFVALHQLGETVPDALRMIPASPTFSLLLDRIRKRLTADERRLLESLAVYRRAAPADAFVNEGSALHGLLQRGLAQRGEDGGVALQSAVRDVVYRALGAEARARLHLHATEICTTRAEFTEAAHHALQAGQPELAVWTWFTHREQEILQGQAGNALAMFRGVSRDVLSNAQDRKALALLRAELWQAQGESGAALDDLNALSWPANDPATPQAQRLRGDLLDEQDRIDEALNAYRDGLASAAGLVEAQAAKLHARSGLLHMRRLNDLAHARREADIALFEAAHLRGDIEDESGNYAAARERFEEALGIAVRARYALGEARAHTALGILTSRQNQADAAAGHFDRAEQLFRASGEIARAERNRSNLAFALIMAGRHAEAIEQAGKALAFFERTRQAYWIAVNANNLAEAHLHLNQLDAAEHYADVAIGSEEPSATPYALFTIGMVRQKQGRLEQAAQALRDAIKVAQQNGDRFAEAPAWRGLGQVHRAESRHGDAAAAFAEALALYRELNMPDDIVRTEMLLAAV